MSATDPPPALDEELAKLEETARAAALAIANARNVREAMSAAEVEVPHHLKAVARVRVPALGRLVRVRDLRIEDIVKDQLAALRLERSEMTASRELDRLKASDWSVLRSENPDLYSKTLHAAKLIMDRKSAPRR